jgi:hypothetical protein
LRDDTSAFEVVLAPLGLILPLARLSDAEI